MKTLMQSKKQLLFILLILGVMALVGSAISLMHTNKRSAVVPAVTVTTRKPVSQSVKTENKTSLQNEASDTSISSQTQQANASSAVKAATPSNPTGAAKAAAPVATSSVKTAPASNPTPATQPVTPTAAKPSFSVTALRSEIVTSSRPMFIIIPFKVTKDAGFSGSITYGSCQAVSTPSAVVPHCITQGGPATADPVYKGVIYPDYNAPNGAYTYSYYARDEVSGVTKTDSVTFYIDYPNISVR